MIDPLTFPDHFRQNALDQVPKKREDQLLEALESEWKKENSYQQAKTKLGELIDQLERPLPDVFRKLSELASRPLWPQRSFRWLQPRIAGGCVQPTLSNGSTRS